MSATRARTTSGVWSPVAGDFAGLLYAQDLWPILLYPSGVEIPNREGLSSGKEPIGNGWGDHRWTLEEADKRLAKYPGAGLGVCLGPGRGPGGSWLVDIEGDGEGAEASRLTLFDAEMVETVGWKSARGRHQLFVADVDRLAGIMPGLAHLDAKIPGQPGVFKSPTLPGLELRLGGFKSDGKVKQVQSSVPPTPCNKGIAREWIGPEVIADLPEGFYRSLESLASPAVTTSPTVKPEPYRERAGGRLSVEERVTRYLDACGGAVSGQKGHDKTFKVVCTIGLGFDLDMEETLRLVRDHWNPTCEPRWSEADLRHKVEDAYRTEKRRPGWLLEAGREDGPVRERAAKVKAERPALGVVAPDPAEQPEVESPECRPRFANYDSETYVDEFGRTKTRTLPYSLDQIRSGLEKVAPGWPKRVDERLFVEDGGRGPLYLGSSTRLFSWIDNGARVDWTKGARFITQERFYEDRRMRAERFDSIETLPHVPRMGGSYYMHRPLPDASGRLDELVAMFSPASPIDRQLIKALIVTPLWGGMPGTRPAFLITGPDWDPEQGRGLGKSTMLDLISHELFGGPLDISPGEDIAAIKTRILGESGLSRRIMRLDNLKTLRFSWADLENLITAPSISGRMLYVGNGERRNDLVWILTLNGASLSKDMAQRVVTIKLGRPTAKGSAKARWRGEVAAFMREHRWAILADAAALLAAEPGPIEPLTRWADWESSVLSKLEDAPAIQRVVAERQDAIDEGNSDREMVRDALISRMESAGRDPETATLKIPSATMAEIVSEATRKHYETATATSFVKGLAIPELIQCREAGLRGWIWTGLKSVDVEPELFAPTPRRP